MSHPSIFVLIPPVLVLGGLPSPTAFEIFAAPPHLCDGDRTLRRGASVQLGGCVVLLGDVSQYDINGLLEGGVGRGKVAGVGVGVEAGVGDNDMVVDSGADGGGSVADASCQCIVLRRRFQ